MKPASALKIFCFRGDFSLFIPAQEDQKRDEMLTLLLLRFCQQLVFIFNYLGEKLFKLYLNFL